MESSTLDRRTARRTCCNAGGNTRAQDMANKLLRGRDPSNFRFSILQLTAPDLIVDEVIALEQSWKLRLRTATPYGLNEN